MILLLVLSVIPGIVLIIQNGINLHTSSELLEERITIKENIQFSIEVGRLIHSLQYERDVMSLYISADRDSNIYQELEKAHKLTDRALFALSTWKYTSDLRYEMKARGSYHDYLRHFRDTNGSRSLEETVTFFSMDIQVFIDWMVSAVKEERHSDIWADLVAYNMLINGKESVGIERALGAYFFINGGLDMNTLLWFKGAHEMALRYLKKFTEYSVYGESLLRKYVNGGLQQEVDSMRDELLLNDTRDYSLARGFVWMDNMTSYINQLDVVNRNMVIYIETKTAEEIFHYNFDVVLDIVILILTLIIAPLLLFFIYKVAKKVDTIRLHLEDKTINLEKEQQRTENLLSQLVPGKIARKIRTSRVVPEFFTNVTVMVSDISNLETFLVKSTPSELIEMINSVFDVIERRIAAYNVSKIGAVGNLLYAASGLNQEGGGYHLINMADFALDIMERTRQVAPSHVYGEGVQLAIALNTGSVVAGVVNTTVPRYCLYGQTIIEATNILSVCLSGNIQVSDVTSTLLANSGYSLKPRDDLYKMRGEKLPKCYVLLGKNETGTVHVDLEADCADV